MIDLRCHSAAELLALHANINEELRTRGVLRSANSPTGDMAEHLFCTAFHWNQAGPSAKGFDATDSAGKRYQIKARRLHRRNKSRQVSALRNLGTQPFDFLAGLLLDEDFNVFRAALIPHDVVLKEAKFQAHTNSHIFHLRDALWKHPGVEDATAALKASAAA